jgi:gluconate 2-dehydrogenase gamma chain
VLFRANFEPAAGSGIHWRAPNNACARTTLYREALVSTFSRRTFIKLAGATAATLKGADASSATTAASPGAPSSAHAASARRTQNLFFNAQEAAFVSAAVARIIPTDETGPGATEADVAGYIDRQLAGAWGAGERLYRSGPWQQGAKSQGYQLPFTPAELFRNALRPLHERVLRDRGKAFAELSAADQDAFLKELEKSTDDFGGVPGATFFASLLEMTIEGFFSDPVYGGNRDMVGWKLIGFPGAYANYYDWVDKHNVAFVREPASLADDVHGTVHVAPNIPVRASAKGR